MWCFAWVLGVGFAGLPAILKSMWDEAQVAARWRPMTRPTWRDCLDHGGEW